MYYEDEAYQINANMMEFAISIRFQRNNTVNYIIICYVIINYVNEKRTPAKSVQNDKNRLSYTPIQLSYNKNNNNIYYFFFLL